ncbi:MAG: hypothetical protein KAH10_07565 [Flavobacteriales bacterium]|nr:hypothetical protein [Flavobacteriales bacterium]
MMKYLFWNRFFDLLTNFIIGVRESLRLFRKVSAQNDEFGNTDMSIKIPEITVISIKLET